jgi:hypothetical protein
MTEKQALARLGQLPAPANKRKPWRVYGPGEQFLDHPSENKAYIHVRYLTSQGETVSVYVYENERWVLFEHLEPAED